MSTISTIEFNLTTLKTYNETMQAFEDTTLTGKLYTVEGVTDATGVTLRRLSMAELVMVVCLARAAEKERAVIDIMAEMESTTETLNNLTAIEKQILEGASVNSITGNFNYNGTTYTRASDFLKVVVYGYGSSDPNSPLLEDIYNQMAGGTSLFDIATEYAYNGTNYSALDYLDEIGAMDHDLYGVFHMVDVKPDDESSLNDIVVINLMLGLIAPPVPSFPTGCTWGEVEDILNDRYGSEIMSSILARKDYLNQNYLNNQSLPSSTDQLISDIESKMDSLNSFSQQKMIELQSETNKRDQAYDMITNILKSMNTVQVGN
ncbi:MAG: hypothetical protein IKP00_12005, partial [Victivallales bacterium]|nr:hypothetical protein [Victivallales bacterium]